MQFQDKVCVVTGAGNGIGRATALELGRRGGKVVLSDVHDESGESAAAELRDAGGEAVYVHADMRSNDDILALMDTAVKTFGRLDVLHNNAGIHESDLTTDMTVTRSRSRCGTLTINLKAVWPRARRSRTCGPGRRRDRERRLDRIARRLPVPGLHDREARDRRLTSAWRSTSARRRSAPTATARPRSTRRWCPSSGRRRIG